MVTRDEVKQVKAKKDINVLAKSTKSSQKDKIPRDKKSSKKTQNSQNKKTNAKKEMPRDTNTPYNEKKTYQSGKTPRGLTTVTDDAYDVPIPHDNAVVLSVAATPHVEEERVNKAKEGTKKVAKSTKSHGKGKNHHDKNSSKKSSRDVSKNIGAKTSQPEVTKVMIDEVDAQEKEISELAKDEPVPAEQGLQIINARKDKSKEQIKSVAMVKRDEEERVKAKEDIKKVAKSTKSHGKGKNVHNKNSSKKTSHGVSKNIDVKTSRTKKERPRDDNTTHEITTAIDETNIAERMNIDKTTPVIKVTSDEVDVKEKERKEIAKDKHAEQELKITNVRNDKPGKEIMKDKADSIKPHHEEKIPGSQIKSDKTSQNTNSKRQIDKKKTTRHDISHDDEEEEEERLPAVQEEEGEEEEEEEDNIKETDDTFDTTKSKEEPEAKKGMINEVDAQGKKRAEIAKRGPATAEPKLQTIKVKEDAPTQEIKNVAMVTQDEEERIKAEENMMEVGENENTIVKTPLDDKKTPRDDKTLQDVKIVIDDANKPGRVKLDKIIPRDKDGEGFLTPNGNAVLPSISVTPHLPKQEQEVIKGSSDDVVAKRKERADLAEVELALAEQALQIIKVRKALMDAIEARNSKRLIAITQVVRDKNYEFAMKDEMWKAKNLIERLQHIRKLWHAVLELDHNTVAEVKGYAAPPPAVSKVLSATLLILGHYVEETKEWIKVQNILSRTGKESLLQRVGRFDIDKVDPGMAMGAKEILKDLTLQQVRVVSAGAATFYVWTKGLINEIETRMGEDILNTRPRTRRPRKNWELARSRAL